MSGGATKPRRRLRRVAKVIRLGPYKIHLRIARGGMADVYAATRETGEGTREVVAIKRIRRELSEDPAFLRMFLDEARIARQLDHPNICKLLDVGGEAASTYLVMELVQGVNVKTLLARGPLAPRHVVTIAAAVAEALHAAHEQVGDDGRPLGVVHRDVTPMNVMVTFDGEVKLLDFGIAVARGRAEKTQAGVIKGKWSYLSPEQVLGEPLDRRADLFALGALMYEMLTARRAFPGDSPLSVLRAVATRPPEPLAEVAPEAPAELVAVVERCLEKRRADRFQTAREVAEALGAVVGSGCHDDASASDAEALAAYLSREFDDRRLAFESMVERLTTTPADSADTLPAAKATPAPAPFEEQAGDLPSAEAVAPPRPPRAPRSSSRPASEARGGASASGAGVDREPLSDDVGPEPRWPLAVAIGGGMLIGGLVAALVWVLGG